LCDFNKSTRKRFEELLGENEYDIYSSWMGQACSEWRKFADVEIRVQKFIDWLISYVKKNKVNVAISAHGNSIRLFRKIWEKKSKEEAVKWFIPYDKFTSIKYKLGDKASEPKILFIS
jgi:broad specificity phosphatase PhoE